MHINRGDKLDAYPFRLPTWRNRRRVKAQKEVNRQSSEDFKRMLAKPRVKDWWEGRC